MWNNLGGEVQGALLGVSAFVVAGGVKWAVNYGKMYVDTKILKNGNGKCNGGKHCGDHKSLVEAVNKLTEQYEDEKQIGLYTEAIKRANGYQHDARD